MNERTYHIVEIAVLIATVALPNLWGFLRLMGLLKDFPPHRHINGKIIYPKKYEPTPVEKEV